VSDETEEVHEPEPWWIAGVGRWTERVAYSAAGQFAYRPAELLCHSTAARDRAIQLLAELGGEPPEITELPLGASFLVTVRNVDPLHVVAELADEGLAASPNYVLFAHADKPPLRVDPVYADPDVPRPAGGVHANPVYANPVYANPVYANPVYANGVYASTMFANPVYASPVYANPVYAHPVYANQYKRVGRRTSSARPADASLTPLLVGPQGKAKVIVMDTGLAEKAQRPPLLSGLQPGKPYDAERPDTDGDGYLDPCAGHGTFAAGIVEQLVPGVLLGVGRVLSTFGDGDEARIGAHLAAIDQTGIDGVRVDEYTIINLSFGGYAAGHMAYLAKVLRRLQRKGVVVVASAGNDATWRPTYPAVLDGVVSVGALGTDAPAPFTNYGPWVRACAPGVDLVSSFFADFIGSLRPLPGSPDPDDFAGWARWSGTSFAAPIVAAALAMEVNRCECTAAEAVARLIDSPGLFRLPGLGTVVNVLWPGAEPAP
jgi:hypothetical protein